MSRVLIQQYYTNLERAIQFGKSTNEQSIRSYFWMLLNDYAHKYNYELVKEVYCRGTKGVNVRPDGIVKNAFGLDIGLWESKDEKDNIDDEISAKLKKGYPFTNIFFEDSNIAVLFQRGEEVKRINMKDADELHKLVTQFMEFKSDVVYKFEEALNNFTSDVPTIVETLRLKIEQTQQINDNFVKASLTFLELCKAEINPDISEADIREMIIQHILTSDIFNKVFDDADFHKHNNIASELEKLIEILFSYSERKNLMGNIEHYYDAINSTAAAITDHHEKQKFLKVLYESFYKVYNPKAADRLGVVYTPNEIVQFMIESTDYLLHKHFNKTLADKNVEILDPATGTGTFITSLIDYIPLQHLTYKYKNEIHANEVAILPYYIANLNIEYTYKQKTGMYEEFNNLCFVDTLDNVTSLSYAGKQHSLFGLSSENTERIKRQNSKKISVIIGNPPYNANQRNENENNKNREYPNIDKRIKDTYIKNSTAQKTKVYDMYARFYRWASDRLDDNGVLAFITNRSFIDSRTFDGFRKVIQDEFSACYIVDTKSDVRTNPKIAGTTHNVFGIQTGVAIMFLVKNEHHSGNCRIEYISMEDEWRKEIKLNWLRNNKLGNIPFQRIEPDKNNNWINLAEDNDWESLLPLADKDVKLGRKKEALFELFSLGVVTARDEWVYDFNEQILNNKVQYFCNLYNSEIERWNKSNKDITLSDFVDRNIKWTEELENHLLKGRNIIFDKNKIIFSYYRPFFKKLIYYDRIIIHRLYQQECIFPIGKTNHNKVLCFTSGNRLDFSILAANILPNYAVYSLDPSQGLPLFIYDKNGDRKDNITDWGLQQFVNHYKDKKIKKEDIFIYVYGVLHNPEYRKKYELNLKREFPRLPFYEDFWKWAEWGKSLMNLHINYEIVEPYDLKVLIDSHKFEDDEDTITVKPKIKVKLKADKTTGTIELDEETSLKGVPSIAWDYKLGNRSALEWILDQYKEKKPSDPTIAEKFNTYRFADYKEQVIDLLKRVCTVSVETMKIIKEMEKESE